jgi:hypothetical protein
MTRLALPLLTARGGGSIVTGRFTEPGEVADLALFLASPRAGTSPAPTSPLTAD